MLLWLLLPILVAWPAGVILVVVGAYASAGMNQRALRSEVPENVEGLRTAERAYDAAFDEFVPCGVWPRALEELDRSAVGWDAPPDCYQRLGWVPDGDVRGTYRVDVVSRAGDPFPDMDFVVHGWSDVDGDGEAAHYTATRSTKAVMLTDDEVR